MHPLARSAYLALILSAAAASTAWARPPEAKVKAVTSGDFSERVNRVPIERSPGRGERAVLSLTPKRLPSLAAGDRLELSTELQVTVDCTHRSPRCIGDPYRYNPGVLARMVIGPSAGATSGPGTLAIGEPRREVCRQRLPNREHHCVIVFSRTVPRLPELPCLKRRRCFINVIASAGHPKATRGDFLAVGGNRPNGSIPQDRSRLNLVRFHPAGRVPKRRYSTEARSTLKLHLDQRRHVIYTQRLEGLRRGGQLVVEAHARMDIGRVPYNVVLASQLILTDRRGSTTRGSAARLASMRGEIDEGNGFNCTRNVGVCTVEKVGVVRMLRDAGRRRERPRPLFVSLVTRAGPKRQKARSGDRVVVRRGGRLRVERYASRFRG